MKLIGLMAWFDEQPDRLAATVSSLGFLDHLVAIDGCYFLFPESLKRYRSPQEQLNAIVGTAYGLGIGLTLHVPDEPFAGNEVEKRNLMFKLAQQIGTEEDWLLIVDSDEVVTKATPDLKDKLAGTDLNVATYLLKEPDCNNYVRGLMRCLPDLRVEDSHYGYRHGERTDNWRDGYLWVSGEEALELVSYLQLEHRKDRPQRRTEAKESYNKLRQSLGVELAPEGGVAV
jgi:hypothetical protein